MPGPGAAPTVQVMLSSAVPGSRVRPVPHRLLLGWAAPAGTVLSSGLFDVFAVDDLTGHPVAGAAEGWVAVRWDGRRRPEWVDPADLVPAPAVVAVA